MWETNFQSLGSWHALNFLLFLCFASIRWVGGLEVRWEAGLSSPSQKAALQRNSTAVSESVWSCLLALLLLSPPAVLCPVKGAEEPLELL